ncbi:MAG: histidine phosphatase family protein, partial [Spirochaetaceae bacterium]|nr:histidine phosphatase family protein [Spirochaetaceae bacterium]
ESLTEQNYGKMEGCRRFAPDYLEKRSQFAVKYPDGESMLDVAQRIYNFLDEAKTKYANFNHILLVCHGGTIRLINTYFKDFTNQEFADFRAENCQIQTFL